MIVVFLYSGQHEAAWASYQDFLDVEPFSNSAEAMSAENLFDGYCSGEPAVIKQRLGQGRCWQNLDSGVRGMHCRPRLRRSPTSCATACKICFIRVPCVVYADCAAQCLRQVPASIQCELLQG